MTGTNKTYEPIAENHKTYNKLYKLYKKRHDGFGLKSNNENMYLIMKELLDIRDEVRGKK